LYPSGEGSVQESRVRGVVRSVGCRRSRRVQFVNEAWRGAADDDDDDDIATSCG
jgi:hypothetical protein